MASVMRQKNPIHAIIFVSFYSFIHFHTILLQNFMVKTVSGHLLSSISVDALVRTQRTQNIVSNTDKGGSSHKIS